MNSVPSPLSLVKLSLADPIAGGRVLLALNPPMPVRWMLLAAVVSVSVLLLYLGPAVLGDLAALPPPFGFLALQSVMNLVVIGLIAQVGRAFGGQGDFAGALWLVGWMQGITVIFLIAQIAAILLIPSLNMPVAVFSVGVSIWILVGYVCALHGFRSRLAVLSGMVAVFMVFSFLLSIVLVALGFDPAGASNV